MKAPSLLALVALAGCQGNETAVSSPVVVRPPGDVECGGSIAIQPVSIDNCAYCSFDDYPTGRAPLPPDAPAVTGPVDIRALIGPDCEPREPDQASLVAALRAAIDDALAIARERVQGCYSCPGSWEIPLDACGLPDAGALASQLATGCAVEVTLHAVASCTCADDPHAPAEICGDGRDNDGDGLFECEDPGCRNLDGSCDAHETDCADGVDNDRDGDADCRDPDCANADGCRFDPVEICVDGVDNDGDGAIDCADPDCAGTIGCLPVEPCGDGDDGCPVPIPDSCAPGVDPDGDGLAGCADPDCRTHPACWTPCGDDPSCWF